MLLFFFFQAEDGIRDLVRSRGLGDVYKRQVGVGLLKTAIPLLGPIQNICRTLYRSHLLISPTSRQEGNALRLPLYTCLLYTSDAADERSSVDLGGRRIIKKKKTNKNNIRYIV